jgi:hypothetical protein
LRLPVSTSAIHRPAANRPPSGSCGRHSAAHQRQPCSRQRRHTAVTNAGALAFTGPSRCALAFQSKRDSRRQTIPSLRAVLQQANQRMLVKIAPNAWGLQRSHLSASFPGRLCFYTRL